MAQYPMAQYPNSTDAYATNPGLLLAAIHDSRTAQGFQDMINQLTALLAPLQPQNWNAQTLRDSYLQQAHNQYPMIYSQMVQPGNLDLYNRPILQNPDGSYSTTSSMSFNDGQYEVIVPTVATTDQGQVQRLTPEQAIERYRQTNQHLGKFTDWQQADDYAQRLHEMQEQRIAEHNGQPFRSY